MRHSYYAFLLSAAVLSFPAAGANADAFDEFLTSAKTFQAEFLQEIYSAGGEIVEESAGRLSISRPGRFRWEYDDPEQLIVADGEQLWLYDIELDQITVSEQAENLAGSPAALLGGDENALDDFNVLKQFMVEDIEWTRLEPKNANTDFRSISIGFRDGLIVVMELKDALEQTTRIRFSDVTMNAELADDLFDIEVPDGVDVINQMAPAERSVSTDPADG